MQHEVSQHDLAGGAKLMAINIPNAITFFWSSFFRAGYRFVDFNKYELPHLAEHMAFEGTKAYPDSLKFKIEVEKSGTYYNAHTNYNFVNYEFIGSTEDLERIVGLNLGQVYEPLFGKVQVRQQKEVIEKELSRKKENDGARLKYLSLHNILPQVNPDMEERISNSLALESEDLARYHQSFYGSANTYFILSGNFDSNTLKRVIDKVNSYLKTRSEGRHYDFERLEYNDKHQSVYAYDPYLKDQAFFTLRFALGDRDDLSAPALVILSNILTGGLSGRLGRKAREAGLTYGINASGGTSEDFTIFSVTSQTVRDKLRPLLELALNEVQTIASGKYEDSELEHAIGMVSGAVRRGNQTPSSIASWYVADYLFGRSLESTEEWIEKIRSVNRESIAAVAAKYLTKENVFLNLIGRDYKNQSVEYEDLLKKYFA